LLLDRAAPAARRRASATRQEGPGAPHGVYPCAGDDRWIAISVFADDDWRGLCRVADDLPWTGDARFATREGRVAHAAELDGLVAGWTRGLDADVAMERLQAAGVAAGRVADAADLCARDPQLAARGHFVEMPTAEGCTVRLDGPAFLLPTRRRGSRTRAAPRASMGGPAAGCSGSRRRRSRAAGRRAVA
jgi:crotonobetainyl-CoA:carnitine CoA-transferase CaiB-like acyl-CoA transferase